MTRVPGRRAAVLNFQPVLAKSSIRAFAAIGIALLAALPSKASRAEEADSLGVVEAIGIAVDTYIFGYPLVTFDRAEKQQTNVAAADAEHAPVGQMIKMRSYPAVDNHCCAAPNADTLYTEAWLDVSKEPWIVGVPEMGDRYYIVPILDGWSEVIGVASSRTNGGMAQTYAITGPGWTGTLPPGVTEFKSPTGIVWMLGRIYSSGTPDDYQAVHALQDKFVVVPLNAYGKPYTAPLGLVDPAIDMKTAVRKQVDGLDIYDYFERLAKLMKTNPPTVADAPIVARMARIGLVPGEDFDPSKLGFIDRELIRTVPKLALLEMARHLKQQKTTNGWLYFTKGVGNFGTNYVLRGMANLLGPGWNRPQDAVYPLSQKDADDDEYDGYWHNYVVHFEKGQLPPAEGFWSLTLYDTDFFFAPNPINRYERSERDPLAANPDGSIDMYLQAESGKDKEANWLPAPKGKFDLVLRIYAPRDSPPSILDGSWTPPPVKRAP
jgi:hypothetical protein